MIKVLCQLSIQKDGLIFLSPTKTELLREILACGNLSGAAQNLKISYQHAWTMVQEMNAMAPEPVVVAQRGGAHGGGTEISAYGKNLLTEYRQIEGRIETLIRQINVDLSL